MVDAFALLIRNAPTLGLMVSRDLSGRYKGTAIGLAWLVLLPIVMMAIYAGLFAGVLGVRFPGANDPLGASLSIWISIILWQGFAEACTRAASAMHDNAPFVKRVPFPIAVLPAVPLGTALCGMVVSIALFLLASILIQGAPPAAWVQAPFLLLPYAAFSLGCCWMVSAAGVFVRDLRHVLPIAMTLAMFATPVVWPLSAAPASAAAIIGINPAAWFFESLRGVLFSHLWLPPATIAIAIVGSLVWMVAGYAMFRRVEKVVADVV